MYKQLLMPQVLEKKKLRQYKWTLKLLSAVFKIFMLRKCAKASYGNNISIYIYYIDTDEIPGFFLSLKIISSSRAVKILFLSFTWENIGVAMVTNIIFLFFIRILTFWNRKYKYYCLYFSSITLYPSFITFLWQVFCDRWPL